jgi:hypothetical protein
MRGLRRQALHAEKERKSDRHHGAAEQNKPYDDRDGAFGRDQSRSARFGDAVELTEYFRNDCAIALIVDHREHTVDRIERLLGGS